MSINLAYISRLFAELRKAERDVSHMVTLSDVRGEFWVDIESQHKFCTRVHNQFRLGYEFAGKQSIALLYGGMLCLLNKLAKAGRLFCKGSNERNRHKVAYVIPYVNPFGPSEVCNRSLVRVGVVYEYEGGWVFGRYLFYTILDLQNLVYVA